MKYISIFGYYGFENTGDDAVLRSLLDDLCRLEEEVYVVIFSDAPERTETLYGDADIHACRWDDYICLNMAISQSDLLLIGGGGLYNCYLDYPEELFLKGGHRYFSVVTFGLPYLAKIWGTPCAVIGSGASEILSAPARRHIGESLPLLSDITVRDTGTREILSGLCMSDIAEIRVTADPVFRLDHGRAVFCQEEQAYLDSIGGNGEFVIGVALRNWFSDNERAIKAVAAAVNTISRARRCTVLFLAFDNGQAVDDLSSDSLVAHRLQALLEPDITYQYRQEYLTPYFASRLISLCDVVIAMRLHPVVMSVKNGIPVIGLMYDRKVRSMMRECGLEEYCLDLDTVSEGEISGLLDRVMQDQKVREKVKEAGAVMGRRAEENIHMVHHLLEGVPQRESAQNDIIFKVLRENFQGDIRGEFAAEKADALQKGDFEKVRAMCRLIHPDRLDGQAAYELAFSLHQSGKREEALVYYESALAKGFSEYWVRYNRGQLYLDMGELEQAGEDIRKAYEIDKTQDCKCVLAKVTGRHRKR